MKFVDKFLILIFCIIGTLQIITAKTVTVFMCGMLFVVISVFLLSIFSKIDKIEKESEDISNSIRGSDGDDRRRNKQ